MTEGVHGTQGFFPYKAKSEYEKNAYAGIRQDIANSAETALDFTKRAAFTLLALPGGVIIDCIEGAKEELGAWERELGGQTAIAAGRNYQSEHVNENEESFTKKFLQIIWGDK